VVKVQSTTASTTTSSGALVVGNGTSGGLGVGGSANIGGTLTVTGNLTNGELHVTNGTSGHSRSIYSLSGVGKTEIGYGPNGYGFAHPTASYISYVDGLYFGVAAGATSMTLSTSGNLTVAGTTISLGGGSGSIASVLNGAAGNYKLHLYQSGGVDRWYCGIQAAAETGSNAGAPFGITALSDAGAQIDIPLQIVRAAGGSIFFGRPVKAQDTTASTGTSSGALVVSGGVGVAGNVSSGGQVAATGTGTSGPYIANSAVIDYDSSTARFYGRGPNTSTRPSLGFYSTYSDGAGGLTLMTFNTSGAATIASSLTTGAPSGGTAAAWKLGAVATVSPTSPNRTIEVDIGGTIYYIHAKTTNN
jgi:hypothetical protein